MGRRGNGEGSISKRKDGRYAARYWVDLPNGEKKRRYIYGKDRQEVADTLAVALGDRTRGIIAEDEQLKFGEYLDSWLNDAVKGSVATSTFESYTMLVEKHIKPALGSVRLSKLTPSRLQGFYRSKLDDGYAPRTVAYLHAVTHRALKQALRWGLVVRNVAEAVDPPRVAHKTVATLSPEQARALLEAAKGKRLEALYVLAIHTGMRQGELLALKWDDVDLDAGVIRVRGTKTARSRRIVGEGCGRSRRRQGRNQQTRRQRDRTEYVAGPTLMSIRPKACTQSSLLPTIRKVRTLET